MNFWKKIYPYLLVFLGFSLGYFILLIVIDAFVLPYLIHRQEVLVVPDLKGKKVAEAEVILKRNGFEIIKSSEQYSEEPAGTIINQNPRPGTQVKNDRAIYITVSKGEELVNVPYLVGTSFKSARLELINAGLRVGEVTYQSNENYGIDTVISQSKKAGEKIPIGSPVNLVISRGAELQVSVPNLINRTLEEANAILTESKLILGEIQWIKNETYLPNTVVNQTPSSGTLVKPNTPVNVTVTK